MKDKIREAVLDMLSKVKVGSGHSYIGLVEPVKGKKLANRGKVHLRVLGYNGALCGRCFISRSVR